MDEEMRMDEEMMEAEVLSYREFRKRETLLAWKRRRGAIESPAARSGAQRGRGYELIRLLRSLQASPPAH